MARNGIFCLEGEWWEDYKRPTTVEPALQLLKSVQRIPYVHRNVATVEELAFYMRTWLQRRHRSHPILYLCFHGDRGKLHVGGTRIDFDWLEQAIGTRGRGRFVHFGSCLTMNMPRRRLDEFLQRTRLEGAGGYRKVIDWMDSMTMDLYLLARLGVIKPLGASPIAKTFRGARRDMPGLAARLALAAWTRGR